MPSKARKKPAKKAANKSVKKASHKRAAGDLLAKGGGAGPAAGVTFQGWVGAFVISVPRSDTPAPPRVPARTMKGENTFSLFPASMFPSK
jgi:hypothetical protein